MSVIVFARFPVPDVARALAALNENGTLLEEITDDTKKLGAIHHLFATGEGELIVIDEWDTAEHFNAFFGGNPKVEKVTTAVGVQGPPTIEVFEKGDAPGTF
jgi:hypothetical protein